MPIKKCIKCGDIKDETLFVFDYDHNVFKNVCKTCTGIYLKKWRRENEAHVKNYFKKENVKRRENHIPASQIPIIDIITEKVCSRCNEIKPIELFARYKNGAQKRVGICDDCKNSPGYIPHNISRISRRSNNTPAKGAEKPLIPLYKQPEYKRAYEKQWKDADRSRRIGCNLRSGIWSALKGIKRYYRFEELVGCTDVFLRDYLESKFQEGMNWDNYGCFGWHVDHILPMASFNLKNQEEQKKCCHFSNLQPLWWWDNLSKGSKIA